MRVAPLVMLFALVFGGCLDQIPAGETGWPADLQGTYGDPLLAADVQGRFLAFANDFHDGRLPNRASLVVLDAASSRELWRTSTVHGEGYSAGKRWTGFAEFTLDSTVLLQVAYHLAPEGATTDVRAYDAATGAEHWNKSLGPPEGTGRGWDPVLSADREIAYFSTWSRDDLNQRGNAELRAYWTRSGTEIFNTTIPFTNVRTMAGIVGPLANGTFVIVKDEIHAVDPVTGSVLWRIAMEGNYRASAAIAMRNELLLLHQRGPRTADAEPPMALARIVVGEHTTIETIDIGSGGTAASALWPLAPPYVAAKFNNELHLVDLAAKRSSPLWQAAWDEQRPVVFDANGNVLLWGARVGSGTYHLHVIDPEAQRLRVLESVPTELPLAADGAGPFAYLATLPAAGHGVVRIHRLTLPGNEHVV